ncbi:hypothetical protein Tco_0727839 [Tanacetum coccineum]|uniref:Uncharacterized protein n=1 Tax=Tanacetum coccineum TaxID=301880 RepID=A0ABQ4YMH9_9ASTR
MQFLQLLYNQVLSALVLPFCLQGCLTSLNLPILSLGCLAHKKIRPFWEPKPLQTWIFLLHQHNHISSTVIEAPIRSSRQPSKQHQHNEQNPNHSRTTTPKNSKREVIILPEEYAITKDRGNTHDAESLGEDAYKQGSINSIDVDEDITLVNDQDDADMFDVNTLTGDEVLAEPEVATKDVNLIVDEVFRPGLVWGCDRLVIRAKVIENQVILFGDIPTVIPSTSMVAPKTSAIAPVISYVAPMVETTLVASPIGLCGLVPYSGSDSDSPDEVSSPEHISLLPAISPFLCTDSSEAPDSSDGPPSQDPYVATVARWRSRVSTRPSSSSEFPIAPITAPPGICRRSAIPGEAIPFGRPYHTHLNRPRKLLTARKRVGPLPACGLACRHASPRSLDHRSSSSSSSSDSLPVHSSGLDASDQAYYGSSTRDVSPRLGYPPRRAP